MTTKEDGMSNELERVARALAARVLRQDPDSPYVQWREWQEAAEIAIAAMTPTPQVVETATWRCDFCGLPNEDGDGKYARCSVCGGEDFTRATIVGQEQAPVSGVDVGPAVLMWAARFLPGDRWDTEDLRDLHAALGGIVEADPDRTRARIHPTPDVDVLAEVRALRDSAMYANFSVTQLDPRENDAEFVLAIRVSDLNSILDREPTQ